MKSEAETLNPDETTERAPVAVFKNCQITVVVAPPSGTSAQEGDEKPAKTEEKHAKSAFLQSQHLSKSLIRLLKYLPYVLIHYF